MKDKTTIWIKGMVCPRCIRVVKEDLESESYEIKHIEIGKVIVSGKPNLKKIDVLLQKSGFTIVEDVDEKLVENIKTLVLELIENNYFENNYKNNSAVLEDKLKLSYAKLSRVFSLITGSTLERFIIAKKIEKAKEFFKYSDYTIENIAYKLGYSSTAHLSRQFKSLTGFSPSEFKKQIIKLRS